MPAKTKKKGKSKVVFARLLPEQHEEIMRRVRADGGLSTVSDVVRRLIKAGLEATR